jgi:hypothetical protein
MEWLVLKNRRHEGPYKEADLRRLLAEGKILVDDYVVSWRQAEAGELNYIPLRRVLGLQTSEVPVAAVPPGESSMPTASAVGEPSSPEAIPAGLLEAFDSSDLVPVQAGPEKPSPEELAVPRLEAVASHSESAARAASLGTLARFQRGFGLTVAAVFLALLVGAYLLLKKNYSGAPRLNAAASRAAPVARPPVAAAASAVSRGPLNLPTARSEPTPRATPEPSPEPAYQPPAYAESPASMPPLPMSDNLAAQEVERLHLPQGQAVENRFPSSTGGPGGAEAMIMPYPGQPPMPGAEGNAAVDPYAAAYGGTYPQGYLPAQGEAMPTPPEYAPPGDQAPPPAAGYPNPPQEY